MVPSALRLVSFLASSASTCIEQRLPWNWVYSLTAAGNLFRSKLSRLMYGLRSIHAPEEQNLPTMSVENETPTSGPVPAPIAWVIFSSSWPPLEFTVILGWDAWKSLMMASIASPSRSVNGCQKSTVPEASAVGDGGGADCLGAGVQPAATSAPGRAPARAPAWARERALLRQRCVMVAPLRSFRGERGLSVRGSAVG